MEPKVTAILMLMVADTLSNPNRIVNYNVFCVLSTSIENLISIFFYLVCQSSRPGTAGLLQGHFVFLSFIVTTVSSTTGRERMEI